MSIVEKAIEKLHRRGGVGQVPAVQDGKRVPGPSVGQATTGGAANRHGPHNRLVIDRYSWREAGLLPPETEERRLAAEYRRIKRPLVEQAFGEPSVGATAGQSNVIMVASAHPGEGKSFTAFNLALSLSLEQDTDVLLVDADVAKPQLTTLIGLENRLGLLDALKDESVDVESLIYDTDMPGLSFLGAGSRSEMATELIASQRMHALMTRLRSTESRRLIVLDSPPLLLTTESRELATVAGQIVMVVRAGVTPRQAVIDAIAYLGEHSKVRLVLNDVDPKGAEARYYGYGPYGMPPERTERAP